MKKADRLYKEALIGAKKKKPNNKAVFELLQEAFELGNPKAAYAMATWYLHGNYVKKDWPKGNELLKFAVENNVPEACFDLANSYESGKGIKQNKVKAFKLYTKGALLGHKQSFEEVGRCYCYGIGVKRDLELADIWLDKAEKLGIKW